MKVLIAEDDYTSRMMLHAVLTKWGYDTLAVDNGRSAMEALEAPEAPRLVILDWNMPEMDGLSVCKAIRKRYPQEPFYIIMLTARIDKQYLIMGLDAGANDYIIKPYDQDEVRARVHVGQRMVETQQKLEKARQALAWEARHDPLTCILNRRAILEELGKKLDVSMVPDGSLVIAMFDLDHFKKINDGFGHQAGDDILCAFTTLVESSLAEGDLLGRYGGEEFLALVHGAPLASALPRFETIRRSIAEAALDTRIGPIPITVSIGLAAWTPGQSLDELLAAADQALYEAKGQGRNRICCA